MLKSAPDTRNRLDSNKGLKRQPKKTNLKEIKEVLDSPRPRFVQKITKGMLFKALHGYPKRTARIMRREGIVNFEIDYKTHKKARKLELKKIRQKKHADASAYRRANSKSKGSKGSKPANKVTK